ncbi:diguanylate cyclase domain-containing protein [Butyrivibrio sp. MC2013]|uniref:diguanylate cyclase domain-containing protein n=1 Tax=Butyrivibrio sp. MC2013 TaxID=1280686 RepID=UPI0003FC2672|nr:GGDEF domain-containing protein [Butyrivibrio sp. MC2013]
MRHKKIALFVSHIYGEYQKNLSQGVIDRALEYGYRTEVYATNDGENLGSFSATEDSVLSLPSYNDLEGIIFASGTYAKKELRERIRNRLSALRDIPVIELGESEYTFPHIYLENNATAGILTEHMITVHGAARLCFLGDQKTKEISLKRQAAFEDALLRNNIRISENDIYIIPSDPISEDFDDALKHFTVGGKELPDAIICYNDEYALAIWRAALAAGYNIPTDFAITGCDCLESGQNMDPPLTTVSFPIYKLGTAAVDSLVDLIKGREFTPQTVFAEPVYGGSCGCSYRKKKHTHVYPHDLEQRIASLESSILISARMSSAFSHAVEMDDGLEYIANFASQIDKCTGFYLCLTEGWDALSGRTRQLTEGSSEPAPEGSLMELALAIQNGKRLPVCTFPSGTLLPDYLTDDGDTARIVSPIYAHKSSYGYIVMTFDDNHIQYPFQLIQWLVNISQLLYNLRNRKNTEALSERLEEIYMKDSLTGLYNKNGFDYYSGAFLSSLRKNDVISALFIDMNGLKQINDTYGHSEGDFALQVISQAIRQALSPSDLAARIGGDEFNILINGDSEDAELFIDRLHKYLSNYNKLSTKLYDISAGSGYASGMCRNKNDMEDLFKLADQAMYKNKNKKAGREQ